MKLELIKNDLLKMKKGFTIVEVSILFVIFLIVAFLVVPLSLDDSLQARNASRWRKVQSDFENILYSINVNSDSDKFDFISSFQNVIKGEIKEDADLYKITYMNGSLPGGVYNFNEFKRTYSNATIAYKLYPESNNGPLGVIMYDVNGEIGPNSWGKDIFGYNIYKDRFEPFCKAESVKYQKQDCSKTGKGICCSNYYLIGGSLN